MVSTPPPPVNPNAPHSPQRPDDHGQVPGRGFKAKPMHFLGMDFNSEEAGKLWQTVIQSLNQEISKDKQKAIKAIQEFNKDSED